MSELVKLEIKNPDIKQKNSNIQMRKSKHPQSINTSADRILFLQRTIGNQAVSRLIESKTLQAKLKIGQPGDIYEQEADQMAEQVMHMPEPQVQRQAEEEEETLQYKPLVNQITPLVQVQRQEEPEEEEELFQAKPLAEEITPLVQRQIEPEEEEEELQAKTTSGHLSEVTPNLESHILSLKGGGQPLSESERTYFEPRFGRDFSQVRVHTDNRAAESAQLVNARAFTVGHDVLFGAGQYAPESSTGQRLMAHELTHVVQQGNKLLSAAKTPENVNTLLRNEEKKDYPAPEPSFEKIMSKDTKNRSFPEFTNPKELAAFNSIKKQLKMDPRDPKMTIELLSTVNVTKPELKKAFDIVLDQLRKELHYKTRVKDFFQGWMDFTQNLQISYHSRFMKVAEFLELKNEDVARIFITRLVSEGFEAIGEIKLPPAKIMAESFKVIWDTYNLVIVARSADEVSLSLIDQLTQLDDEFNDAISEIEKEKNIVLQDWVQLQQVGELTWPASTKKKRKELGRSFEINLWKELLSTKWKHMTRSDDPTFDKSIGWINEYIESYPHYYITYKKCEVKWLFGKYKGYYTTKHWLGSRRNIYRHSEAPKKLAIHLFQTLGISREEVFKNWNLSHQTLIMPTID